MAKEPLPPRPMFVNIDTKRPKSVSSGKPTATTKKTAKKR